MPLLLIQLNYEYLSYSNDEMGCHIAVRYAISISHKLAFLCASRRAAWGFTMKRKFSDIIGPFFAAFVIVCSVSILSYAAITQISGLAVAGTGTSNWANLKDATKWGDPQTSGIGSFGLWGYTGTGSNFERIRGSAASGIQVNQATVGSNIFSIKREDITTSSVAVSFSFTSRKVLVSFPLTNTDEVCIDWQGTTAVCPAANTAGDARYAPGTSLLIDDIAVDGISAIAASGTQTIYVNAFN